MTGDRHRRIVTAEYAIPNRIVMPYPVEIPVTLASIRYQITLAANNNENHPAAPAMGMFRLRSSILGQHSQYEVKVPGREDSVRVASITGKFKKVWFVPLLRPRQPISEGLADVKPISAPSSPRRRV
jgi:hypothetical protein